MRLASAIAIAVCVSACGGGAKSGAKCGDGKVQTGEDCDDGELNGTAGDNCTGLCTWLCADPRVDCDNAPPCETASCTADHTCAFAVDPSLEGMSCGLMQVCRNGQCVMTMCGNGILEPGEDCDWGVANGAGTGCEADCKFSCTMSPDNCDDGNPCNGLETCGAVTVNGMAGQKCSPGTFEMDGLSCGTGKLCIGGMCLMGVCGDGYVTAPEECDDANQTNGDGCNNDCTYSCVSNDPTRNCTPADACAGMGTCNDTTHVCAPGTPLVNGTMCGTGNDYCENGTCTTPVCGNGIVEPGESCDDGTNNGTPTDGCTTACTYVCVNPATDCGTPPACEMWSCTAQHTCAAVADTSQNGMSCGTGLVCNNGSCAAASAVCGNGIVETGEQCDFGSGNGPGTGCEANCTFSCTKTPNSCDDGNACNGLETCNTVTVAGHTGQKCAAGTPEANGTTCGTGKICLTDVCVMSTCGDGFIDTNAGETCEPPNTSTCDSQCHLIVCGNGVRQGSEQCDDGNTTNLDGCDSQCKFEQVQRMNTLDIAFNTDGTTGYCTKNLLGTSISGSTAETDISQAVSNGVHDGSITVIFNTYGLDDLTGTTDPALQVGVLGGTPAASASYVGDCPPQSSTGTETGPCTNDLDWWYTTDLTTINASRVATSQMPAAISSKTLNVPGPVSVHFSVNFVGVPVDLHFFSAKMRASIGATSAPTISSAGASPGHLTSEHLDPALVSFQVMSAGELCGDVTTRSLYTVNTPSALTGTTCNNFYTTANTLLDVYIFGCKAFGFITEVSVAQPDASVDGATYKFQGDPTTHKVTGCTRTVGTTTTTCTSTTATCFATCLDNAGYTSLFRFTTDRIISK